MLPICLPVGIFFCSAKKLEIPNVKCNVSNMIDIFTFSKKNRPLKYLCTQVHLAVGAQWTKFNHKCKIINLKFRICTIIS